ncbi:MAG: hypothetical protein QS721_10415 [Candidatus Endonucleobacter sp. (ex Gigantidas childressi)]|nr:hypothetical protein [Candidatus Endonucleobacter sp. (ex Gigantidas childressi)]
MSENYLELNILASRAIYKDFISGRIINKHELIEGELTESPKFRELVSNLDKYRSKYYLLGYLICSIGDEAFRIHREDKQNEYNDNAADIQVLIQALAIGVYSFGVAPGIMLYPNTGISEKMINDIGELEQQRILLETRKYKLPLVESVKTILVRRGVMYQTMSGRYCLTQAGLHLFKQAFVELAPENEKEIGDLNV